MHAGMLICQLIAAQHHARVQKRKRSIGPNQQPKEVRSTRQWIAAGTVHSAFAVETACLHPSRPSTSKRPRSATATATATTTAYLACRCIDPCRWSERALLLLLSLRQHYPFLPQIPSVPTHRVQLAVVDGVVRYLLAIDLLLLHTAIELDQIVARSHRHIGTATRLPRQLPVVWLDLNWCAHPHTSKKGLGHDTVSRSQSNPPIPNLPKSRNSISSHLKSPSLFPTALLYYARELTVVRCSLCMRTASSLFALDSLPLSYPVSHRPRSLHTTPYQIPLPDTSVEPDSGCHRAVSQSSSSVTAIGHSVSASSTEEKRRARI